MRAFADHLGSLTARLIATRPKTPRAHDPGEILRAFADRAPPGVIVPAIPDAVDRALAAVGRDEVVVITGSIYTAGEALAHLQGRPG